MKPQKHVQKPLGDKSTKRNIVRPGQARQTQPGAGRVRRALPSQALPRAHLTPTPPCHFRSCFVSVPSFSEPPKPSLPSPITAVGSWNSHAQRPRSRSAALAPAARAPQPAAFNATVTSNPAVLSEGLTSSRKAEFFMFNGKIDAKCCTEHLLFEDLQEKMDTRQFPSSGLCSWEKKKKKRHKTILCKGRTKKTVRTKNASDGYSPVRRGRLVLRPRAGSVPVLGFCTARVVGAPAQQKASRSSPGGRGNRAWCVPVGIPSPGPPGGTRKLSGWWVESPSNTSGS